MAIKTYDYPSTVKDPNTNQICIFDKAYPNGFATYIHPKGYMITQSAFELGLIKGFEVFQENLKDYNEVKETNFEKLKRETQELLDSFIN